MDSIEEKFRMIRRTAEMSAGIMRDARRTGGWDGAERVARQFDRIAKLASPPSDGEIYSSMSKSGMSESEIDQMYSAIEAKLKDVQ